MSAHVDVKDSIKQSLTMSKQQKRSRNSGLTVNDQVVAVPKGGGTSILCCVVLSQSFLCLVRVRGVDDRFPDQTTIAMSLDEFTVITKVEDVQDMNSNQITFSSSSSSLSSSSSSSSSMKTISKRRRTIYFVRVHGLRLKWFVRWLMIAGLDAIVSNGASPITPLFQEHFVALKCGDKKKMNLVEYYLKLKTNEKKNTFVLLLAIRIARKTKHCFVKVQMDAYIKRHNSLELPTN